MTANYIYDIAGTRAAGNAGDGGIGYSAEINGPSATALDSAGDMYLADTGNNQVREVSASSGDIAVAAGNGLGGESGRRRDQSFQAAGGRADAALLGIPV